MRFTLLIYLLLFSFIVKAQSNFETLGLNVSEQLNLPSQETYKIKQDSHGNIWVLSDGGVLLYNGNTTKLFTQKNGLPNSVIFDMYEDQFGRIWFLGLSVQLSYYQDGKIHSYRHNPLIKEALQGKVRIWKEIYVDSNDAVYYSINGAGTHKITKEGEISRIKQKDGIEILEIENHLLVSLNMLKDNYRVGKNLDTVQIDFYYKDQHTELFTRHVNSTIQPYQQIKGTNYCILYNKILREQELLETESKSIFITPYHNEVLVATAKGFYKAELLKSSVKRTSPIVLPNEYITSILVDKNGAIWISTLENGIYYFQDLNLQFSDFIKEKTDKNIHKIFTFNDDLYALSYHQLFNLSKSTTFSTEANKEFGNHTIFGNKLILSRSGTNHGFKTKFEFKINLPEELRTLYIPSMLLQPFVENAVIHGSGENNTKDFISIDFQRLNENTLHIIIFNSQKMSLEQKEKWHLFENDHATGITKDRIASFKSLYKNKELSLSLDIDSKGTAVHINVPILKTN